jgi:uncharacterized repeat protein (TIGR03803 family)
MLHRRAGRLALLASLLSLSPAFADEQVLKPFKSHAAFPPGDLVRDDSGNLYGVTQHDGANGLGTVYRYSPDGHYTVLHDFSGGSDGAHPAAGLIRDADGNLYGTTFQGGPDDQGTVFRVAADGSESVLYAFKGGSDGAYPFARLARDRRGNLYGTTSSGGNSDGNIGYWGTVFKLAPSGRKKVIYAFNGSPDAEVPLAGVIRDKHGNLYGTTVDGGAYGWGAVYKITPDGQESVLASMPSVSVSMPGGEVVADDVGNLYGTTSNSTGSVFKITPDGVLSTLFVFPDNHRQGQAPHSTLLIDGAGNLFGTAMNGGRDEKGDAEGCGSVFKVTPRGKMQTLHLFAAGKDGCMPVGGLTADGRGDFFGTTFFGYRRDRGTIFKVTP